jgi:predicted NBD/HSP70 family sugar kinase
VPTIREIALKKMPVASVSAAHTMLRIVRAVQPISRADLARRLEVHRSTVTEMVKPLLASGVLCEAEPEQGLASIGRPPIGLSLRDESAFFIGVNIGVRRSQVGAASVDGRLLDEESFDTPAVETDALARIRASVERLRTRLPARILASIGVSVPGPVDAGGTRLLFAPQLGWRDVEVAEALRFREGKRARTSTREAHVIVENDATAAALYEARRRLRNSQDGEHEDFVLVRAGTGIGVGLVLGGEVYRGTGTDGGLLGEFGHMTIVAGGKPCACGNRGCWERYASAASASALYAGERRKARGEKPLSFVKIVERALAGELRARATLERTGEYLGIGIGNVICGFGISHVIVSGRLVYGWKFIETPVREAVARTMAGRLSSWSVEAGEPTGAGLGGALEVVLEHHLATVIAQARSAA